MMKTLTLLLLMICMSIIAVAQRVEVRAYYQDTRNPIPFATIQVYENGQYSEIYSGIAGINGVWVSDNLTRGSTYKFCVVVMGDEKSEFESIFIDNDMETSMIVSFTIYFGNEYDIHLSYMATYTEKHEPCIYKMPVCPDNRKKIKFTS